MLHVRVFRVRSQLEPKRLFTKRSWVWTYFAQTQKITRNSEGKKIRECTCTYENCGTKVECMDSNTTQMIKHLEKKHQILPPSKLNKVDEKVESTLTKSFFSVEDQQIADSNLYGSLIKF